MSNSVKNLTALEKEESEKMKKELEKRGLDKPEYSLPDMKYILSILNESKETANRTENNTRNQKDMPYSTNNPISDVTIKIESISTTDNDRSKPSCSYNIHRTSNSEVSNVRDKRNIHRKKSTDDDISDDAADKYLSHQKSTNSLQESYSSAVKNKVDLQIERKGKLNRWRINPLDSQSDLNDVPLQQPQRPPAQERIPFRLCKGPHTNDKGNKVMNKLGVHLKEMADLWLSCRDSTQVKFQWGTPIQVDTASNSSGRKPLVGASNYNEVGNISSNYDRACKRKAVWTTNAPVSSSSSDDNDEISLSILKKMRTQGANKLSKTLHNKEPITQDTNHLKQGFDKEDSCSNNNFDVIDENNTDSESVNVKTPRGPNKTAMFPETLSSPTQLIPSKSNVLDKTKPHNPSLSVQNHEDSNNSIKRSPTTSRKEAIRNVLTTKDIVTELEKSSDEDNEAIINEDVVIKPLPMKNFSARLAKQCAYLKQVDVERKKKVAEQKEVQRKEDVEKEKKRQDFLRRRMQEVDEVYKQKEEMQEKEQEKEKDKWIEIQQSRSKNRMEKWKEQEKKQPEKQRKEALLQDNDNMQIIEKMAKTDHYLEKKITCPICNKSFPSDKIENHAAMCEQFETDSENEQSSIYPSARSKHVVKEYTKNSETLYECNICSSFKTDNGVDYEDHVNRCIQRKQNSPPQGSTPITIDIPNSPIRSYRPISEQRNSNIDYSGQLHSQY